MGIINYCWRLLATAASFALFGLGDQKKYPDEFVDAIGILHDTLADLGAHMIGRWPTEGYEFSASRAVDGNEFLGLALDQHHQAMQTESRIDAWLGQIKADLLR